MGGSNLASAAATIEEAQLPETLRTLAAAFDDRSRRVVVMVGTGISLGATGHPCAGWQGLLLDGLDFAKAKSLGTESALDASKVLVKEAFLTTPFDFAEVLQRAEALTQMFGGTSAPTFAEWFGQSIGTLTATDDCPALKAIAGLARSGAIIITTNYDNLLCQATGLAPVTWLDSTRLTQAIVGTGEPAIIHLHGHFSQPDSIVLGTKSYARVKANKTAQFALRTLWAMHPWLYLGCGKDGLDDPNLGALFSWVDELELGAAVHPHYFLGLQETVEQLPDRFAAAANTVAVAYPDHDRLPGIIDLLRPAARPAPFEELSNECSAFRHPDTSALANPRCSWDDILDGAPPLETDITVLDRLETFGWAVLNDSASMGKTTLALRLGVRAREAGNTVYYFKLNASGHYIDDPYTAFRRLAEPNALFIIDDAHLDPDCARKIWDSWLNYPAGSRLLIAITSVDKRFGVADDHSLAQLVNNTANRPLKLRYTADDLIAVARHIAERSGHTFPAAIDSSITQNWHRRFAKAIGGFIVAVTQRLDRFAEGDYSLPDSAAADWIRDRHFRHATDEDKQNAILLAVISGPQFEVAVPAEVLPHPSRITELVATGLVRQTEASRPDYSLREPIWGPLILEALDTEPDMPDILARIVAVPNVAAAVAMRFNPQAENLAVFLATIRGKVSEGFISALLNASLPAAMQFAAVSESAGHQPIAHQFWNFLGTHPDVFASAAAASSAGHVRGFLGHDRAKRQAGFVDRVWACWHADPAPLVECAARSRLDELGAMIRDCSDRGEEALVNAIWACLEDDFDSLRAKVMDSGQDHFRSFDLLMKDFGKAQLREQVWSALTMADDFIAQQLAQGSLKSISMFMGHLAKQGKFTLQGSISALLLEHSETLAGTMAKTMSKDIVDFQRNVPAKLFNAIAAKLPDDLWSNPAEVLNGSYPGQLADTFEQAGRSDLAEKIIPVLLRDGIDLLARTDKKYALVDASIALRSKEPELRNARQNFTAKLFTKQFANASFAQMAPYTITHSLYRIAQGQFPSTLKLLWSPTLRARVQRAHTEIAKDKAHLIDFICLYGAAELIGMELPRTLALPVPLGDLYQLPLAVHADIGKPALNGKGRILWCGLMALSRTSDTNNEIDPAAIADARSRLNHNMVGTDDRRGSREDPSGVEHKINLALDLWFSSSMSGSLSKTSPPLWQLAGFGEQHICRLPVTASAPVHPVRQASKPARPGRRSS